MAKGFFHIYDDDNHDEEENEEHFDGDEWSAADLEKAALDDVTNQKNIEEFHNIMSNASKNLDSYWDKNNFFIRLVTYIIWVFAILGVLYYFVLWFSSNK